MRRVKVNKINFFACILLLFMLTGCPKPETASREGSGKNYNIIVIEECEYIEVDLGVIDNRVYSLTHKGNCKKPHSQKIII